ncbi:DUF1330 domain-containing protein [Dietzia psychralcaliphila]|uniref:DUF1330 domain-containing protein n=1 Tax=Dietzia psychralcaliphila TaxID=139021 RepID=UPI001C1E3926|nr:DUF1330 domain-containing protein [Dietzia psychralcaliphila]
MTVRLCVLLWPYPGREGALLRYENRVLPLIAEHGGTVCSRDQVLRESDTDPLEVQRIDFPDARALDAFMSDPRRIRLEHERADSIARTDVLRLA